ncbi:MAG: SPFH domain-containing protein [Roseiflexus sp.]|nr:SPFH domain-containing protein [Roseiflexus sp.]MDW8145492.1 SPFH domain-containing protein [Roseiflexaceae bacterium]
MADARRTFSRIKETVAAWSEIRQLLRSGEDGQLVPVVIPRSRRRLGWLLPLGLSVYLTGVAVFSGGFFGVFVGFFALIAFVAAVVSFITGAIVEIEQGTTGILSRWGQIVGTLAPGRHYLWRPWEKVEAVVDTSTEIPYTAPVLASPTRENIPLKSIEFFLKFRIEDPIAFVRRLGASNFDLVLSSAVQDAIRQRARRVETERAYDLRGSDVGDMQELLNRQLARYGVRITGANIPNVQLPDQYQQHLATRERVTKELQAYEREWELIKKQRIDSMRLEIERARKVRDAKLVEVRAAINQARQDVARMLQEKETEAQRVRWEIEARGRATLRQAENEARGLEYLGRAYQDNRAVLQYELARRRLQVAEALVKRAPRPIVIQSDGGDQSPLTTLITAQLLPQLTSRQDDADTQSTSS